jgi:hypothetical protein
MPKNELVSVMRLYGAAEWFLENAGGALDPVRSRRAGQVSLPDSIVCGRDV